MRDTFTIDEIRTALENYIENDGLYSYDDIEEFLYSLQYTNDEED